MSRAGAIGAHAPGDQAALRGVEPQLAVHLRRVGLQRDEAGAESDDVGAAARELVADGGVGQVDARLADEAARRRSSSRWRWR